MIVAGQLRFDAAGRVLCIRAIPDSFSSSTPTLQGLLCFVDNLNPPVYKNGYGYENDGRICVREFPLSPLDRGLRLAPAGDPIDHYWCGLPFTADGRLAVTEVVVPPPFGGAFDPFAFDNGFDIGS